jgi:hypothetical protein
MEQELQMSDSIELRGELEKLSNAERMRVLVCLLVWDPAVVGRAIAAVKRVRDQLGPCL